jgi:hypothetical protein
MSSTRNANVVRCCVSRSHEELILIDSGADTCMMGHDFHIESTLGKKVTIEGFGGHDTLIKDLEMGTGVTLITCPNREPILLRVNHGVLTQFKSILSANHMRSHGLRIDDVPRRFQGGQSIWLNDGTHLPLLYKNALCFMSCRKPTPDELETLEIHDITSPDDNWYPSDENDGYLWFKDDDDDDDPNDPDHIYGHLKG